MMPKTVETTAESDSNEEDEDKESARWIFRRRVGTRERKKETGNRGGSVTVISGRAATEKNVSVREE